MTLSLDLSELERAAELVHRVVSPTPQYAWPKLRQRTGCTVWVKHENHTPTGAFKVRGGIVYLDRLTRARRNTKSVARDCRESPLRCPARLAARESADRDTRCHRAP